MKFNGPFVLINEKNNYELTVQNITIDLNNTYFGECAISFNFNSNITEFELNKMFNISYLTNNDYISKKDIASDFKLFEFYNRQRILSLELKNGVIYEYNLDDCNGNFCKVYFDWYIVSYESRVFNKINNIRESQEKLFKENLDRLKNQPPVGSIEWLTNTKKKTPSYINDNESIWEHNTKHSFLPWNWFKNHKITPEETFDWH